MSDYTCELLKLKLKYSVQTMGNHVEGKGKPQLQKQKQTIAVMMLFLK